MTKKRYTVTAQFYIDADNDEEAIRHAQAFAKDRQWHFDDNTEILFICETPFAGLSIRQIYPNYEKTN